MTRLRRLLRGILRVVLPMRTANDGANSASSHRAAYGAPCSVPSKSQYPKSPNMAYVPTTQTAAQHRANKNQRPTSLPRLLARHGTVMICNGGSHKAANRIQLVIAMPSLYRSRGARIRPARRGGARWQP